MNLTKKQKAKIHQDYHWAMAYMLVDVITKMGDPKLSLEDNISDVITMYHNALRANFGEK